jgi:hypothetical protein
MRNLLGMERIADLMKEKSWLNGFAFELAF